MANMSPKWWHISRSVEGGRCILNSRVRYLVLIVLVASSAFLLTSNSWADADDVLEPGEQEFDSGAADKGNEDSDPVAIGFGNVTSSGSGCPADSARATASPDGKTISILFDRYSSASANKQRVVTNCNLRIPVRAPVGFRAVITRFDFRGFAAAPPKGRAVLRAQYEMLGANGRSQGETIKRRKLFQGPVEKSFTVNSRFRAANKFTNCGESFVIALNTRLIALSQTPGTSAMIQLDSVDGAASNVQYHVRWKRCR